MRFLQMGLLSGELHQPLAIVLPAEASTAPCGNCVLVSAFQSGVPVDICGPEGINGAPRIDCS
jgi:hypothetical protein